MNDLSFEKHCWVEIDLDALRHNFTLIRQRVPGTPVCAVVKADAYGHGDIAVARVLAAEGAAWFAVSCLQEALHLRRGGILQPILILGYTAPEQASVLAENNITQTVFSLEYGHALSCELKKQGADFVLNCHLKVDTGMGRIGFDTRSDFERALREMDECFSLPGLSISGLFQHFAVADSHKNSDVDYTEAQHALFLKTLQALEQHGHHIETAHCCNSAGQMLHPDWALDLVRAGIILYGCPPSEEVPFAGARPVMTMKTVVSQVKELLPGETVSYGRDFCAKAPMRVATCCVGYADGYPRQLTNQGILCLHGKPAPVIGRVCMDQLLVDVSDIPEAAAGDEVIVFGPNSSADTVDDVARKTGTINYEILCAISRRVSRIYLEGGHVVQIVNHLDDKY